MAKGSVDNIEYAIKLYVSRSAFEAESGLYRQRHDPKAKGLSQFLPWVRLSIADALVHACVSSMFKRTNAAL